MARLIHHNIEDRVYRLLQKSIEQGRLKPGARIYEDVLAKELGISKTPLRLALRQLKQDGVVQIEPRRGVYVAVPSVRALIELIEMREVLEGLAARRAASYISREQLEKVKSCFQEFNEDNVHEQRLKYAAADHRFHHQIVDACGSDELIKSLQVINIRLHMNRLRAAFSRQHDLRPIHREHTAIIGALEAGDGRLAETLVRKHVRAVPWQTVFAADGAASVSNSASAESESAA